MPSVCQLGAHSSYTIESILGLLWTLQYNTFTVHVPFGGAARLADMIAEMIRDYYGGWFEIAEPVSATKKLRRK